MYKIRNGLKGYADKNKKDPVTNKKLKNPYFGRDMMCSKCDTCPWLNILEVIEEQMTMKIQFAKEQLIKKVI